MRSRPTASGSPSRQCIDVDSTLERQLKIRTSGCAVEEADRELLCDLADRDGEVMVFQLDVERSATPDQIASAIADRSGGTVTAFPPSDASTKFAMAGQV